MVTIVIQLSRELCQRYSQFSQIVSTINNTSRCNVTEEPTDDLQATTYRTI